MSELIPARRVLSRCIALPVSVTATLALAPGHSPWRLRPALAALQPPPQTVAAEPHPTRKYPPI